MTNAAGNQHSKERKRRQIKLTQKAERQTTEQPSQPYVLSK
jgi:hypothetical protein